MSVQSVYVRLPPRGGRDDGRPDAFGSASPTVPSLLAVLMLVGQ
jgi:hypothetical protein